MIKFMNMPNRRSQPTFKTSEKIDIKEIQKLLLADSVPVYLLNSGDQDILKLDFVFNAGNIYHENSLIPEITNALIDKGTTLLSSEKISENFDFYGAYLETETGKHIVSVTLYTLNKYFKETFQLLFEILFDAFFPQSEIDIFLKNKYQSFLINQQKTDAVSTEIFAESIFGKNHPYGISVKENDFKNVERGQILNFYREYYNASNMFVMLSGKINDEHLLILKSFLNQVKRSDTNHFKKNIQIPEKKAVKIFHKIENTVQVSIKVGKITINKLHPDFFNLNICSVILGGYFGSRLMTNIREDKGYTYGIYAGN
ncbi:MAG: insulinase family protein, partial [Bacteroidales bacterium]|nr:insulinase family protein [Bacteroidales bacterium]